MGLTFDNPNNLQKMLDRFATVPDPKKTPKHKDPEELLNKDLSLIHISEPTRREWLSRMPSSA